MKIQVQQNTQCSNLKANWAIMAHCIFHTFVIALQTDGVAAPCVPQNKVIFSERCRGYKLCHSMSFPEQFHHGQWSCTVMEEDQPSFSPRLPALTYHSCHSERSSLDLQPDKYHNPHSGTVLLSSAHRTTTHPCQAQNDCARHLARVRGKGPATETLVRENYVIIKEVADVAEVLPHADSTIYAKLLNLHGFQQDANN